MNDEQLPEHERIVKEIQDRIQVYRDDMQRLRIDDSRYRAARTASWVLLMLLDDLGYSL